jgi:hypothetical protein
MIPALGYEVHGPRPACLTSSRENCRFGATGRDTNPRRKRESPKRNLAQD